jgi:D-alanyl-D-alanine carboxypeptidase
MFPASTTKLITAMLLVQNRSREDVLSYTKRAEAAVPYKLMIPAGSWMRAKYAMDALLVYSANDIANMIAENIDGTIEQFSLHMNRYVQQELGLENTHFTNPSGLHSENHYSSAYDLSVIAREIYMYPWIMGTLSKKKSILLINDNQEIVVENRNRLVLTNICVAGKTGWTPQAEHCLVALFKRDERRIAGVILGSHSDSKFLYNPEETLVYEEMVKIIDYSYKVQKKLLIKENSIVKTIPLTFRIFPLLGPVSRELKLKIKEPVYVYMNKEPLRIFFTVPPVNILHLNKKRPAGVLTIKQRENSSVFNLYPTISSHDILRWDILPLYTALISIILIIVFFVSFIMVILRRKKNRVSLFSLLIVFLSFE